MENTSVKEWYLKAFPLDIVGMEIDDEVTFIEVYEGMKQGKDVYDLLGLNIDSLVRERIFGQLTTILNVEYDHVYKLWLGDNPL